MRARQGLIFDIQRYSVHDGPGIRTLVFLKGCPLRCLWCSNPEGQETKPELAFRRSLCIGCGACVDVCGSGAILLKDHRIEIDRGKCTLCGECAKVCPSEALSTVGRWMTVDQVLEEVERDRVFYEASRGGITVSGGEPFLQAGFTEALLKACKAGGIATAIETCGYVSWHSMERVIQYADSVLYDIKELDDFRHHQLTGVSNRLILENARRIADLGFPLAIRYPVIPGFNDDPKDMDALFHFSKTLSGVTHLDLLPYHRLGESKYAMLGRDYPLGKLKPPTGQCLESLAQAAEKRGLEVRIFP
jgi:pyruvate formate lyase activating enzyme